MTTPTMTAPAGSLADRARAAHTDRQHAEQQAATERQAARQRNAQDTAARVASRVLYGRAPYRTETYPADVAPQVWTIGQDPTQQWTATATIDHLRFLVGEISGPELYVLHPCPDCRADDRRAPVLTLADLGQVLVTATDDPLPWPWRCPTCTTRAVESAEAECAELDADPDVLTPPDAREWHWLAADAADNARNGSSEASVVMEALTSIAYSLLGLERAVRQ